MDFCSSEKKTGRSGSIHSRLLRSADIMFEHVSQLKSLHFKELTLPFSC